ncbi:hypothetical protein VTI28DRAFT_7567 [Corynascus sepedonium]
MGNGSWFTADQLAAVFAEWGRRFLVGKRCQMGWVMDRDEEVGVEGWPVMMNTPDVETGEVGEDIPSTTANVTTRTPSFIAQVVNMTASLVLQHTKYISQSEPVE